MSGKVTIYCCHCGRLIDTCKDNKDLQSKLKNCVCDECVKKIQNSKAEVTYGNA